MTWPAANDVPGEAAAWDHGAAQQGVEADEAEHIGASQLNSSVRLTVACATKANGLAGGDVD